MPPFQPGLFGPVTHKLRWWLQKRWCDTQGVQDLQLMEFWIWLCLCCVDHSILRVIYISIQSHNMFCVYIYIWGATHTHTYIHIYIHTYTIIHTHTYFIFRQITEGLSEIHGIQELRIATHGYASRRHPGTVCVRCFDLGEWPGRHLSGDFEAVSSEVPRCLVGGCWPRPVGGEAGWGGNELVVLCWKQWLIWLVDDIQKRGRIVYKKWMGSMSCGKHGQIVHPYIKFTGNIYIYKRIYIYIIYIYTHNCICVYIHIFIYVLYIYMYTHVTIYPYSHI